LRLENTTNTTNTTPPDQYYYAVGSFETRKLGGSYGIPGPEGTEKQVELWAICKQGMVAYGSKLIDNPFVAPAFAAA